MPKIIFAVPPNKSTKGFATATQNRQYQYFKDPTFVYPMIPALFISMIMTEAGHNVMWIDAIAEELTELEFAKIIVDMKPDFIVFEANTMLINNYYQYINDIKINLPAIKILLAGEHVTAMQDHPTGRCQVDYILQGGKWYYEAFKICTGNDWPKDKILPHIDRNLTRWWLYAYKNGNFKYVPATYMIAAQDCWYRPIQPCTFCSWVKYHPENVVRPVEDYLQEVEEIINFGFKEFFDDSGTFPVGPWLREFCNEMIDRDYIKHIVWGCNMRFGALQLEDFKLMAKAGCRFILWGFESANQTTLDRLCKGTKTQRISQDLIASRMAGIWNHLTVMFGYPWETLEDERRTYNMTRWLLLNDWAASAQATICMPYPGTRLFQECKDNGWLLNEDWDKWDMTQPVVKLKYDFKEILKLQRDVYNIAYHPKFVLNKLSKIRSWGDVKFYFRLGKKIVDRFGNLVDDKQVALN